MDQEICVTNIIDKRLTKNKQGLELLCQFNDGICRVMTIPNIDWKNSVITITRDSININSRMPQFKPFVFEVSKHCELKLNIVPDKKDNFFTMRDWE